MAPIYRAGIDQAGLFAPDKMDVVCESRFAIQQKFNPYCHEPKFQGGLLYVGENCEFVQFWKIDQFLTLPPSQERPDMAAWMNA